MDPRDSGYNEGVDFNFDANGNPVFEGDYVTLMCDYYHIHGYSRPRRRVQKVGTNTFTVFVDTSRSVFTFEKTKINPIHTTLSGRHHPWHKMNKTGTPDYGQMTSFEKAFARARKRGYSTFRWCGDIYTTEVKGEKNMLYVAIRVQIDMNYERMSDWIRNGIHGDNLLVDTSQEALKERVRQDIARNPDSRWLMLHGNILAKASNPPVSFTQW